jgi:hypothetical protein
MLSFHLNARFCTIFIVNEVMLDEIRYVLKLLAQILAFPQGKIWGYFSLSDLINFFGMIFSATFPWRRDRLAILTWVFLRRVF